MVVCIYRYMYQDGRSRIGLGVYIQVWGLKLILSVFLVVWGLWSFCESVSQDMNPLNYLWVFCEDVQVYNQSRGVFPRMWGPFLDCWDMLQDQRSPICLRVYVWGCEVSHPCGCTSQRRSLFCFSFSITVFEFLISSCVFVKVVWLYRPSLLGPYPVWGSVTQNVCLTPFLDGWARAGGLWPLWNCMAWNVRALSCLWVYISAWDVFNFL